MHSQKLYCRLRVGLAHRLVFQQITEHSLSLKVPPSSQHLLDVQSSYISNESSDEYMF
jgi:hypothetical protein